MKKYFRFLVVACLAPLLLRAEPGHKFAPISADDLAKIQAALPHAKVQPAHPRKLLLFYRTEGFVHSSISFGNEAIKEIGEKTGAYSADLSDDMSVFTAEGLKRYDAVLFNSTTQLKFTDPTSRQALLDFVKTGKGVIGIHAATDNFPTWPEGQELMGGKFQSHPWVAHDIEAVKIDDPGHPLNDAFGGKGFWINDEIYQIMGPYDRSKVHVLLSLDMSKPQNQRDPKKIVRTDNDFPISWLRTTPEGGRVFYCSLGHNASIYWTPQVLQHYLDGIQFALGDLKADSTPSAQVHPAAAPALAPDQPAPLNPPAPSPPKPAAPVPPAPPKSAALTPRLSGFAKLAQAARFVSLLTATAPADSLTDGVEALSIYNVGQDRTKVAAFIDYVRTNREADHARIEAALVTLLASDKATESGKDLACRQLAIVGSDACVPTLARLIDDPALSQLAVNTLFELGTPAAKSALVASLDTAPAKLRPAVIGAIGRARIDEAVPALAKIAGSEDAAESLAAEYALAAIGTPEALHILIGFKVKDEQLGWALLRAANRASASGPSDDAKSVYTSLMKSAPVNSLKVAAAAGYLQQDPAGAWAAVSGLLTDPDLHTRLDTARLTTMLPPDGVTALISALPTLDPAVQMVIVHSFAEKHAPDANRVLPAALASSDPGVHLAAVRAYGIANLPGSADVLFPLLGKSKDESAAAAVSLGQLTSADLSQALQKQLTQAQGPMKASLLNIVADRQDQSLKDTVYAATSDADPASADAAFHGVEVLTKGDDLPRVISLLPQAKTAPQHKSANKALVRATLLFPDKDKAAELLSAALPGATDENRQALIISLSFLNSTKAAATLAGLLQAPSVDDRKQVIRALAVAHNSNSDGLLLQTAAQGQESSEKILALRGYLDSIQQELLPRDKLLDDYKKAWPLTIRQEEKDQIIAAIKNTRGAPAAKLLKELTGIVVPPPPPNSKSNL